MLLHKVVYCILHHPVLISLQISRKPSLNIGFVPLMYAAEMGKSDCVSLLVEAGASVHMKVSAVT